MTLGCDRLDGHRAKLFNRSCSLDAGCCVPDVDCRSTALGCRTMNRNWRAVGSGCCAMGAPCCVLVSGWVRWKSGSPALDGGSHRLATGCCTLARQRTALGISLKGVDGGCSRVGSGCNCLGGESNRSAHVSTNVAPVFRRYICPSPFSSERQRYQLATDAYGRHFSPIASTSFGVGRFARPYAR
jgi:hypothetical protein